MTRVTHNRRSRTGQALVEAALTLLTFIVTLIAILDFGQILFIHVAMTERIRDGLRKGVVRPYLASNYKNLVRFGTLTDDGNPPFMGLTDAQVSVEQSGVGTTEHRVTLRIINYDLHLFTPFIAGTITSQRSFAGTLQVESVN